MLSHARFGRLRLVQFLPDAEIAELQDWEFADQSWVGEAVGFSEWLRLTDEPDVLRSLALDLVTFSPEAGSRVLSAIQLPLARGMTLPELRAELGDPVKTFRFVPDRVTYEFVTPKPDSYQISCTVLTHGGLTHLVVVVRED